MSRWLVVAPLLIPMVTAFALTLLGRRPRLQRQLSILGAAALLVGAISLLQEVQATGTVRMAFGGWPAPFGIEFVADRLSAVMAVLAAAMSMATLVFQLSDAEPGPASPEQLPLIHTLTAAVGAAFVTGDVFNLYVWFELMLIAGLGLLAQGSAPLHLEATLKYFVLNAIGTLLLLVSVAALYASTGHLNYGALERAATAADTAALLPIVAILAASLLIKCAAFPFSAWLPAAYPTLPAPVAALFAAVLTKVGIYAVLRLLGDVFAAVSAVLLEAIGWLAVATMLAGVLGAAWHWDIRRILAFHSISQIGYILLGIAVATSQAQAAAIYFGIHHSVVKANLFFLAAIVFRLTGSYDLRRCGGLYAARPWLAVLFGVCALSLVGVPPLSGFWAKFLIINAAVAEGRYVWAAAALAIGFLTLYSMLKIWLEAFWRAHPEEKRVSPSATTRLAPAYAVAASLTVVTIAIGVAPATLVDFLSEAVASLREAPP